MLSLLPAVLTGAFALTPPPEKPATDRSRAIITREPYELLTAPDRHVRAATRRAHELIAQGLRRSRTVGMLLNDLEQTDVIVHVELSRKLPPSVAGRLLFAVAVPDGPRYLRVQVADDGTMNQQIAALAHELHHALEVAAAPEVCNERTLALFYERVGVNEARDRYDTIGARNLGRQVLFEIGR